MDLISRDRAQDAVFSKEDIMGYMDNAEDGDINRTVRSAIRLIERVPSAFEGMTNGEVLQAVFPNISVYEHGSIYSVNNEYNFNSTWWNAPYKAERER